MVENVTKDWMDPRMAAHPIMSLGEHYGFICRPPMMDVLGSQLKCSVWSSANRKAAAGQKQGLGEGLQTSSACGSAEEELPLERSIV